MKTAWNSSDHYIADSNAFVLSLVNKENKPFKIKCANSDYAILTSPSYGPIFGSGSDIFISSGSNSNQESYSLFGFTYKHADYQYGT